eukprot:CAMPEP_0182891146 /NCGR_PEP_ID=MMETSP0034_2-20130328/23086_1 /TAXON_ID=156128 /ORGANISM="Nephroselmis pyriformis, Strain CCMP717" /LENGTH=59 /DNA_ID=CAMNT_0025024737 /DNA_START=118 /DNA_END=294 /DNA_ORIENTATION=+
MNEEYGSVSAPGGNSERGGTNARLMLSYTVKKTAKLFASRATSHGLTIPTVLMSCRKGA